VRYPRRNEVFERGITDDQFVNALRNWKHWNKIVSDNDLFLGIRNEYINVYYQGCSLLKVSFKGRLVFETHYKYLVRPTWEKPYVLWDGDHPAIQDRVNEIFIETFDLDSLKKSSSWYAEDEKVGLHGILKENRNVVDVEIALSPESEVETASEARKGTERRGADRIDFAAIQRGKDGKACVVFFEAKRFDNPELRSQKLEPPVIEQIGRYETFIRNNRPHMEASYRRVCRNLVDLTPSRVDDLVKEVAAKPDPLTVDSQVRLVVFGYDKDQDQGEVWNKHKEVLRKRLGDRLLLKGSITAFTHGISK
jgi:hypothetical protein